MDTNYDDKMLQQIETNLSSNMNDHLFSTGLEKVDVDDVVDTDMEYVDSPMSDTQNCIPPLSRAEYIRQAREACLRQLHAVPRHPRGYENYNYDAEPVIQEKMYKKKGKGLGLFSDGSSNRMQAWANNKINEEASPQEIASYRALILRTVCAILIFLCIFAIDKLDIEIGKFSTNMIREYVTGNDTLKKLEEVVVTWFK